ncbi:KRAB-A domain-containing protein 2-like [Diabrotica undecimpunctata]|uniref:KRAB-A domain-containing protein 2-like n=1 Tax=Diabrotica undecimpunctata TaxID=50387 RepID=UPI003B64140C
MANREKFYEELNKFYSKLNSFKKPWSFEKLREVCTLLRTAREQKEIGVRRTNEQHYFFRNYELLEIGGVQRVIKKRTDEKQELTFVLPIEEYYDKLNEVHLNTGHGGRDKMINALKPKYAIPRPAVEIFVRLCTTCDEKKHLTKKGVVVKPIVSTSWNSRGQVDLIDFQSSPDGEYKWLLNYQDHFTKFIHLRPLKSKCATEVAQELLKLFLEFGAPCILQSDNGREFVNSIIRELVSKWPSCKIINGRPRHPQSQGSVERSNQDVENMLRSWLTDNNTTNWSVGCYFVQWQKNSSYHRIIGRTPYKALFGVDFKVGLFSSDLPDEVIRNIDTEERLDSVIVNSSQNLNESCHVTDEDCQQSTASSTCATNDLQVLNMDEIAIIERQDLLNVHNYCTIEEQVSNTDEIQIVEEQFSVMEDDNKQEIVDNIPSASVSQTFCSKLSIFAINHFLCKNQNVIYVLTKKE